MLMKKEIKSLNPGSTFTYGNKQCLVLEHMDDGVLSMVLDPCKHIFDKSCNDFSKSNLKQYLNNDYLQRWLNVGANIDDFAMMTVDLTTDDGLDDYGTCDCLIAPRTCDQHRKYRKLIPHPDAWEWTSTAYSTESNGNSSGVRGVHASGSLGSSYADYSTSVRPLFKLYNNTTVFLELSELSNLCSIGKKFKFKDEESFYMMDEEGYIYQVIPAPDKMAEIYDHPEFISF